MRGMVHHPSVPYLDILLPRRVHHTRAGLHRLHEGHHGVELLVGEAGHHERPGGARRGLAACWGRSSHCTARLRQKYSLWCWLLTAAECSKGYVLSGLGCRPAWLGCGLDWDLGCGVREWGDKVEWRPGEGGDQRA